MPIDPTSLLMVAVIYGCSHHAFGNRCDEDARCWSWLQMLECRERFFGDIHTDAYKRALAEGHNIKPALKREEVK